MAGGNTNAELRERFARLEALIGVPAEEAEGDAVPLVAGIQEVWSECESIRKMVDDYTRSSDEQTESILSDVKALADDHKAKLVKLETELEILKMAVRNARDLENFLWDMSHYFKAARTPDAEKVDLTSMFLAGDAKLWWRTRCEDGARPQIQIWEAMCKELREQFLPTNTVWQA
ncbi:hypothetical protein LguiB_018296 [Lonicera macranthoides]